MEIQPAPTVEDFLVPIEPPAAEEAQAPANAPPAADGTAGEEDTRSEEEKLLAELAGEETQQEEGESAAEIPPPPLSWSKEDAEAWQAIPAEAREVVLRREAERDRFIATKGRESAEAKRQFEQQAMAAVAQQADQFAGQLQAYMALTMPPEPDQRLLYSDDPNAVLHYNRQDAAYRAGLAQQQELQQRIAQSQQQAEAARTQSAQAMSVAEAQRLQEALPEFFDPKESPKLRQELESIGSDLGYTPDLMAQAGATDILALKKAAEWRDKAQKFDRIMAKRMETVRTAKTLPRMTRPGAGQSQSVAQEASQERETAAISQFQRDRSGDAALALLTARKA